MLIRFQRHGYHNKAHDFLDIRFTISVINYRVISNLSVNDCYRKAPKFKYLFPNNERYGLRTDYVMAKRDPVWGTVGGTQRCLVATIASLVGT